MERALVETSSFFQSSISFPSLFSNPFAGTSSLAICPSLEASTICRNRSRTRDKLEKVFVLSLFEWYDLGASRA
jgi:hypothetical protein